MFDRVCSQAMLVAELSSPGIAMFRRKATIAPAIPQPFSGHSLFVCVFFALARAHVWFVIRKVCFISRVAISHCANVSVVPVLQIATIMWM